MSWEVSVWAGAATGLEGLAWGARYRSCVVRVSAGVIIARRWNNSGGQHTQPRHLHIHQPLRTYPTNPRYIPHPPHTFTHPSTPIISLIDPTTLKSSSIESQVIGAFCAFLGSGAFEAGPRAGQTTLLDFCGAWGAFLADVLRVAATELIA